MLFKDEERLKREFWEIDPKLRIILCELDLWAQINDEEVFITSLIRTNEEQELLFASGVSKYRTSVHNVGRGADIRLFKREGLNTLIKTAWNSKYIYDRARPLLNTFLIHEGTAMHIHIQCMPTKREGNPVHMLQA